MKQRISTRAINQHLRFCSFMYIKNMHSLYRNTKHNPLRTTRLCATCFVERRMPKNKVNVRPTVAEDVLRPSELDLNWSLSPLVKGWMRLIAIDPIAPKNKWHWLLWMAHRLLCFTFTVGINAYIVLSFYSETTYTEFFSTNKPTKTSQWNTWIDYVNTAIHAVGVHFYLLLLFPKKWNRLKVSLDNAEYQLSFPQTSSLNTYPRFRNISRVSIALIVFLVSCIINLDKC